MGGVFDPRGSRQMDMQACPLGSLPAGINERAALTQADPAHSWSLFFYRFSDLLAMPLKIPAAYAAE